MVICYGRTRKVIQQQSIDFVCLITWKPLILILPPNEVNNTDPARCQFHVYLVHPCIFSTWLSISTE